MSGFPAAEGIQSLIYLIAAIAAAFFYHIVHGYVGFAYLFLLHQEI